MRPKSFLPLRSLLMDVSAGNGITRSSPKPSTGAAQRVRSVQRPQYMQDLKRGEELMVCESCGRFLYYNRPVAIEDIAKVG